MTAVTIGETEWLELLVVASGPSNLELSIPMKSDGRLLSHQLPYQHKYETQDLTSLIYRNTYTRFTSTLHIRYTEHAHQIWYSSLPYRLTTLI